MTKDYANIAKEILLACAPGNFTLAGIQTRQEHSPEKMDPEDGWVTAKCQAIRETPLGRLYKRIEADVLLTSFNASFANGRAARQEIIDAAEYFNYNKKASMTIAASADDCHGGSSSDIDTIAGYVDATDVSIKTYLSVGVYYRAFVKMQAVGPITLPGTFTLKLYGLATGGGVNGNVTIHGISGTPDFSMPSMML